MDNHAFMDFATSESAQLDGDAAWLAWCDRAEAVLGHDLDGDDSAESKAAGKSDGYSLDGAYGAFIDGVTADGYAQAVKSNHAYRGGLRHCDEGV